MPAAAAVSLPPKARNFPLHRNLPGFLRDPLRQVERIGAIVQGQVIRLDLGAAKPLVVTHPDHVRHILRECPDVYRRAGMSRRPPHDRFDAAAVTGRMAEAVNAAVAGLGVRAAARGQVHVLSEMGRVVTQTVIKIFFGDRVRPAEADRLGAAFEVVATSLAWRFLLPFVPESVPLPRDRAYRAGVRAVDELMNELVCRHRAGNDIFTELYERQPPGGCPPVERRMRDNLVAMFATGAETTSVALTWLWPLLDRHPEVAGRLYAEIDEVLGGGPVAPEHLARLPYTRQVVRELLRLHPAGWLVPRVAAAPGEIGGVPVRMGQPILLSPYLTHRLEEVWPDPRAFDPERFAPGAAGHRHEYAYFPFGGDPPECVGVDVFEVQAQLIVAAVLSRYRPVLAPVERPRPRIGPSMRPRQRLMMELRPAGRAG